MAFSPLEFNSRSLVRVGLEAAATYGIATVVAANPVASVTLYVVARAMNELAARTLSKATTQNSKLNQQLTGETQGQAESRLSHFAFLGKITVILGSSAGALQILSSLALPKSAAFAAQCLVASTYALNVFSSMLVVTGVYGVSLAFNEFSTLFVKAVKQSKDEIIDDAAHLASDARQDAAATSSSLTEKAKQGYNAVKNAAGNAATGAKNLAGNAASRAKNATGVVLTSIGIGAKKVAKVEEAIAESTIATGEKLQNEGSQPTTEASDVSSSSSTDEQVNHNNEQTPLLSQPAEGVADSSSAEEEKTPTSPSQAQAE